VHLRVVLSHRQAGKRRHMGWNFQSGNFESVTPVNRVCRCLPYLAPGLVLRYKRYALVSERLMPASSARAATTSRTPSTSGASSRPGNAPYRQGEPGTAAWCGEMRCGVVWWRDGGEQALGCAILNVTKDGNMMDSRNKGWNDGGTLPL
jgi:hypothetical protein